MADITGPGASVPARTDGEKQWTRSLIVPRPGMGRGPVASFGIRHAWDERQAKQERRSRMPTQDFRMGARGIIEPPYDLDTLAELLSDNPDYYRVVDQFATDVAGRGWDLIDAEEGPPATGTFDEDRAFDVEATRERLEAMRRFKTFGRDFMGQEIPLHELAKQGIFDYQGFGEGYTEVVRSKLTGLYAAGFHLPSRLVRKRWDGTYVQIDETSREVAFFRVFGSNPDDPLSRHSGEEARIAGVLEGELKNELVEFRRYHSAELYYGVPPIITALAHVYGNIFSEARNVRYFYNRALPEWVVTMKANKATFNEDGTNAILDQYEQAILEHMMYVIQGTGDYRTLILRLPTGEVEISWEKLDVGIEDKDFLLGYQGHNRDVIIGVYRMPPHRIGIIETASLGSGSGESQEESYKRGQLDPQQGMVEDFYNAILDDWGFKRIRYKLREIDVIDELRQMQLLTMADATGALSINMILEWLSRIVPDQDFPPRDDDIADIPKWMVEQQTAGLMAGAMGFGEEEEVVPEEDLAGIPGPVAAQLGDGNGGPPRRLSMPLSMSAAVDQKYRSLSRDIAATYRRNVQARRRELLEASQPKPVVS